MTTENIKKKIEPSYDFSRVAAIVNDDPGFVFPCLIKVTGPKARLPQDIHFDSAFGQFRSARLSYDQLEKMADCPDVLSFTFR
jgi:hypothetical protein